MKLTLLFLSLLITSAAHSKIFQCMGDESRSEIIKGSYAGEDTGSVVLETSPIYNIYSSQGDDSIELFKNNKPKVSGIFSDYPLQFVAKQKDDLGSTTTTFAIPLGIFGGHTGSSFQALITVSGSGLQATFPLECEIVGY